MSDQRKPNENLFPPTAPLDELRALLRSSHTAEELAAMEPVQLIHAARRLHERRDQQSQLEQLVSRGKMTRAQLDSITDADALLQSTAATWAGLLRGQMSRRVETPPTVVSTVEPLAPESIVAMFSDMLGILHSQQTQIDELVYERDVFLAGFADRVLDKLRAFSDGGRNYKGFEVTLDLEDESAEKHEQSSSTKVDTGSSESKAHDTRAELKLLASHVGALGAGRKVNVDGMNRKAATMAAASKSDVRARRKGKLTVKMGEISGPKKKDTEEA